MLGTLVLSRILVGNAGHVCPQCPSVPILFPLLQVTSVFSVPCVPSANGYCYKFMILNVILQYLELGF